MGKQGLAQVPLVLPLDGWDLAVCMEIWGPGRGNGPRPRGQWEIGRRLVGEVGYSVCAGLEDDPGDGSQVSAVGHGQGFEFYSKKTGMSLKYRASFGTKSDSRGIFISHSSGGCKPEIRVPTFGFWWGPSAQPMDGFLLSCPHISFLL